MSLSGLIKFLLGFSLAIALLFFAGVNTTRYLVTRLTAPPPKPIFPNDSPAPALQAGQPPASPKPSPPPVTPTPPAASPSPASAETYEGQVTEPIGLIVRQAPNRESEQVGGVEYNARLTVLETSPDGEWLRVRLGGGELEGWVRAGNVEPIN